MKRRLLSIFLSLTMILSMVPSVWAADEMQQDDPAAQETETPAKPAMNGNCGATKEDTVTWALADDDGDGSYTLTISGNGAMMDWKDHSQTVDDTHCGNANAASGDTSCTVKDCILSRPWQNYIDNITKVVVDDGITSIGSDAFNGLEAVTEVTLPDSLTQIGFGAFCRTAITEMTIPEKVSKLGFSAFYGCGNLEKVSFAGNELKEIEVYTFANCSKLRTLQIPDGITTFGTGAVERCDSLEELVFPASVTTLGANGLASYDSNRPNTSLKKVVVKGTVAIPNYMFANCTVLETVDLCDAVTGIGSRAFSNCSSLKSVDGLKAVTEIGDSAFRECTALKSVQFGNQLKTISGFAFDETNLSKVSVPASVTSIGGFGFANTANLKEIAFEGTVAPEIGANAIANDSQLSVVALTNVSDFSKLTEESFVYWNGNWNDQFTVFYVKDADALAALKEKRTKGHGCAYAVAGEGAEFPSCEKDKLATPVKDGYVFAGWYTKDGTNGDWGDKVTSSTKLTAGATYYAKWNTAVLSGDCSAAGNENNVHWELTPNSDGAYTLTISGKGAMADYSCNITRDDATQPWRESQTGVAPSAISKVVVENGVTNIGKFACNGMNHVKEYDIAATVQTISSWGIDTQSVETFTLNENKNFIVDEDGVLMNAAGDTMIAYPGGKAQIAEYEIPASVKTLASGVFVGSQIDKIIIPNTVESVAAWSFSASTAKEVVFDVNVKTLPAGMFSGMANLTQLTFGEHAKIEEIANGALAGLNSIKTFDLPASLKKIGEMGLGQNTSMTELTLPDGLEEIGGQAFKAVYEVEGNLSKLTFGKKMPKMTNDKGSCQILLGQNKLDAVDMTRCTSEADSIDCFNNRGYNGIPVVYTANEAVAAKAKTANNSLMAYAVANGGTFPADTKFEAGKLATPVKDGYRFDGWYKDSGFAGKAVTVAEAGQTYYAKWEVKAEKTAPAAPELNDRTSTSITLKTIEGAQYRCNGGAWQTSPEFTGLTAGTAYTFEAYYPETNDCKASPVSEKAEFSTLYRSSGGSSSSGSSYAVSAPSAKNGDVTVSPKNASKGDRVTITVTPDKGYELDKLTVKDASGNKLKLTDKGDGKYTFTMPGSKVTVSAEFVEEQAASIFADVPADAYYAKAVEWAVKKGITNGKANGLFGSNDPCTRGQIVTFLWRAAGSPAPKGTAKVPGDVLPGSYCYDAVAWALENGITNGLADGTFGVNNTCTRGQSVTFLYRAMGTAPTTVNGFTDVESNAFCAEAVAWAVENGVTNGTTDSTFSPNNGCTRAQIVTFLVRAYNK